MLHVTGEVNVFGSSNGVVAGSEMSVPCSRPLGLVFASAVDRSIHLANKNGRTISQNCTTRTTPLWRRDEVVGCRQI